MTRIGNQSQVQFAIACSINLEGSINYGGRTFRIARGRWGDNRFQVFQEGGNDGPGQASEIERALNSTQAPGWDRTQCRLTGSELEEFMNSGFNLAGAVFEECDFSGLTLTPAQGSDWQGITFRGCRFLGARLQGSILRNTFERCDFLDAKFGGTEPEDGRRFEYCVFRKCDFSGAKLEGNFARSKFERCGFMKTHFQGEFGKCEFLRESVFRHCTFSHVLAPNAKFPGAKFDKCHFSDVHAGGVDLNGAKFIDCDLVSVKFDHGHSSEVFFMDCPASGVDFSGTTMEYATFFNFGGEGKGIANASAPMIFHETKIQYAKFYECKLRGANFTFAETQTTIMIGTDLKDAKFNQMMHDQLYIEKVRQKGISTGSTCRDVTDKQKTAYDADKREKDSAKGIIRNAIARRFWKGVGPRITVSSALSDLSPTGWSEVLLRLLCHPATEMRDLTSSGSRTQRLQESAKIVRCASATLRVGGMESAEHAASELSGTPAGDLVREGATWRRLLSPETREQFGDFLVGADGNPVRLVLDGGQEQVTDDELRVVIRDDRVRRLCLVNCTALTDAGYAAIASSQTLEGLSVEFAGRDLTVCNGDAGEADFFGQLARIGQLESLKLEDCRFDASALGALQNNGSLKSLSLTKCVFTEQLGTAIGQLRSLEILDLSDMRCIGPAGLQFLEGIRLRSLSLTNTQFESTTFDLLASMDSLEILNAGGIAGVNLAQPVFKDLTSKLRNLRTLRVEQCYLPEERIAEHAVMGAFLKREEGVQLERTTLQLGWNEVPETREQFDDFMTRPNNNAVGLVLDGSTWQVTDDVLRVLARDRRVQGLRLINCCALSDAGYGAIADIPALRLLSVVGRGIGTARLAELVGQMPLLQSVEISGRDLLLHNNAMEQIDLFGQLAGMEELGSLKLENCRFSHASLAELGASRSLTSLSLTRCSYTPQLGRAIGQIGTLETLDLSGMPCGGSVSLHFLERLSLKSLFLTGTPCDADTFDVLARMDTLETLHVEDIPYVNLARPVFNGQAHFFRNLRTLRIEQCYLPEERVIEKAAMDRFAERSGGFSLERTALRHSVLRQSPLQRAMHAGSTDGRAKPDGIAVGARLPRAQGALASAGVAAVKQSAKPDAEETGTSDGLQLPLVPAQQGLADPLEEEVIVFHPTGRQVNPGTSAYHGQARPEALQQESVDLFEEEDIVFRPLGRLMSA